MDYATYPLIDRSYIFGLMRKKRVEQVKQREGPNGCSITKTTVVDFP